MKNRAKCKLCESVIESFHQYDYVTCKCGEISIDGGQEYFRCSAKSWDNFLRVDDEDNIIIPKIKEKDDVKPLDIEPKEVAPLTKEELIKMLEDMAKSIEQLPPDAMTTYVNQYDLMSLILVLVSIFKAKDD